MRDANRDVGVTEGRDPYAEYVDNLDPNATVDRGQILSAPHARLAP